MSTKRDWARLCVGAGCGERRGTLAGMYTGRRSAGSASCPFFVRGGDSHSTPATPTAPHSRERRASSKPSLYPSDFSTDQPRRSRGGWRSPVVNQTSGRIGCSCRDGPGSGACLGVELKGVGVKSGAVEDRVRPLQMRVGPARCKSLTTLGNLAGSQHCSGKQRCIATSSKTSWKRCREANMLTSPGLPVDSLSEEPTWVLPVHEREARCRTVSKAAVVTSGRTDGAPSGAESS